MTYSAVIIEGGLRRRRLDSRQSQPFSLLPVESEQPVLDWTLHALDSFGINDPIYVGGYHIEKVIERFPDLRVRYHLGSPNNCELSALLSLRDVEGPLIVVHAGAIVLPGACDRLGQDGAIRGVYGEQHPAGLYYLDRQAVTRAMALAERLLTENEPAGIETLFAAMPDTVSVAVDGLVAPVTDPAAVARTIFRGKAQTLDNLAPIVRNAVHLSRIRLTRVEWEADPADVLRRIRDTFADAVIVVRSSATSEDGLASSAAGKYRSVLDVDGNDLSAVSEAIRSVIDSFSTDGRSVDPCDEILVQRQLSDISAIGVVLTRDPKTGAPYFVVNEDRVSGRPDLVTSGGTGPIEQMFVAWSAGADADLAPDTRRLIALAREIMDVSHLDALDIEYAIQSDGQIYLLQARPLAAANGLTSRVDDADVLDIVAGAHAFVEHRMRPVWDLAGRSTILGVMPDWNPAEMIGLSPRPLALSLYQSLIGDQSWAEARRRVGYRDVRSERLILSVGGRPYVDVRASLNSFLPATLEQESAAIWVDACLERLRSDRALHDKIEFEVAVTCLAPDWPEGAARIASAGLDPEAFAVHLRRLTNNMLSERVESIDRQFAMIDEMNRRREALLAEKRGGINGRARILSQLLDDCRELGVVPFSILARYAFVAMSQLGGLRRTGAIDEATYDIYLTAVPTVARAISEDLRIGLPVEELKARYGHLRPNSYEILSPNYASDPEHFLRAAPDFAPEASLDADATLAQCSAAIEAATARIGLDADWRRLSRFIRRSIAGREKAKFEFMKNLNAVLEIAAEIGGELDLGRDALSFLQIGDLVRLESHSLVGADAMQLERRAAFSEKRWSASKAMRLPDLITCAADVQSFAMESWRANFVTRKRVVARAVWLDDDAGCPVDIAGAVVVIRAADPGYDWIFAHGIAGLVTEYGGVASHMSIRAAEFGLPAAIGCGSTLLETLRGAPAIELDCAAEKVSRAKRC